MAQSARARNSRRITAVDDDVLAASSAGLRAVALPDPTRSSASSVSLPAVSLPSLDMSPSSVPTRPSGRIASATHPPIAGANAMDQLASLATAVPAQASLVAASAAPARSKAPLFIAGAVVLAGAIGGIAYMATRPSAPAPSAPVVAAAATPVTAAAPVLTTPAAPAAPAVEAAPAVTTTPLVAAPTDDTAATATEVKAVDKVAKAPTTDGAAKADTQVATAKVDPKAEVKPADTKPADTKPSGDGPSIDDMLAAAGGLDKTDDGSDKLAKKSLTSDDIKSAMGARRSAAQACYGKFGVAGNVGVKLSVDPSGKVKKATATGALAGTPTAECVLSAARDASFPPWDGSPQTVNFSYTISD